MPASSSSLIASLSGAPAGLRPPDLVVGLPAALAAVPDPCARRGVRHRLTVVLTAAVCAVVAGYRSYTAIGEWVADLPADTAVLLGIDADRRPSEAMIRRLLQAIDPDLLAAAIGRWLTTRTREPAPGSRRAIAVDGKTLRGSRTGDSPARHVLAAADQHTGTVQPGVTPEPFHHDDDGLAWFTAEQQVLLAAVDQAARAGLDAHTWQLAWALSTFLLRRGLWTEQVNLQHTALEAARRLGDAVGQGHTLCSLATGYLLLGRLDHAEMYYRQEQQVAAATGDRTVQARACAGLVKVAEQRGDFPGALSLAHQALDLYRDSGSQVGQANALNGIGWLHTLLGDHHQALACCRQALPLLQDVGYRDSEANTWDSLGYAHRGLADYQQAAGCYQRAVDLYRDLGDRYEEADALAGLGDTYHAAADPDTARKVWHQALDILTDLDHPDAAKIHARLERLRTGSEGHPTAGS
jgi:tetratricopeptide (TPR) repeat protein